MPKVPGALLVSFLALACSPNAPAIRVMDAPDSAVSSLRAFVDAHIASIDSNLRGSGFTLQPTDSVALPLRSPELLVVPPDSADAVAQTYLATSTLYARRIGARDSWRDDGGPIDLTFAGRGKRWLLLTDRGFLFTLFADSTRSTVHLDAQVAVRRAFREQLDAATWFQYKKALVDSLAPPPAARKPRRPVAP